MTLLNVQTLSTADFCDFLGFARLAGNTCLRHTNSSGALLGQLFRDAVYDAPYRRLKHSGPIW